MNVLLSYNKMELFNQNYTHNDFEAIADIILNKLILRAGNKRFRICEIEMYLKNQDHPDKYVHSNPDQKSYGKFYFHKYWNGAFKSGTWKGMDIVLGNEDKYFGVLIRSMEDLDTNEFIEGPCRSVNKILEQFNCKDIVELFEKEFIGISQIEMNNNKINLMADDTLEKCDIYKGPRIGLSDKYPDYQNLLYRYAIHINKIKKNRKTFVPI